MLNFNTVSNCFGEIWEFFSQADGDRECWVSKIFCKSKHSDFFYLGGPAPCGRRRAFRFTSLRSCSLQSLPRRELGVTSVYANSYRKVEAATASQTSA